MECLNQLFYSTKEDLTHCIKKKKEDLTQSSPLLSNRQILEQLIDYINSSKKKFESCVTHN